MFQKIKSFIKNPGKKEKIVAGTIAAAASMSAFVPMVMAADDMNANVDMEGLIGSILGIIVDIFFGIGILLAAWSIGMLVLAFKNEDADSKSRSMMLLVVSVALIASKSLIQVVLDATGTQGFTIGKGLF